MHRHHPSSSSSSNSSSTYSGLHRGGGAPSSSGNGMYLPHPHHPQHPQQQYHLLPAHHPHPHHSHHYPSSPYAPASPPLPHPQQPQAEASAHHTNGNGNGSVREHHAAQGQSPEDRGQGQGQPTIAYAATGRKRKRLQKACIACHKAKRRCDGGLPCSNCDFSGRTCCYSDASGNIVPPTPTAARPPPPQSTPSVQTPAPVPVPVEAHAHAFPPQASYAPPPHHTQKKRAQQQVQAQVQAQAQVRAPRVRARTGTASSTSGRPASTVAAAASGLPSSPTLSNSDITRGPSPSAARRMHLLSTFFNACYPFNQTLDEVALLKEMGLGKEGSVSELLLFAIYALAARFVPAEDGVEEEEETEMEGGEGESERYAKKVRALLAQRQEERAGRYTDGGIEEEGDEEEKIETDAIYASTFLAACDILSAKHSRAAVQTSTAWRMITLLGLERGELPHPLRSRSHSLATQPRTAILLRKLVVVTYMLDVFASIFTGQPPATSADSSREFFKLFAPSPVSSSTANGDGSTVNGGGSSSSDASLSALLHACASIDVFRSVVSSARSRSRSSSSSTSRQEDRSHALSVWASQLPSYLLFNEGILRSATREFHDAAYSSRAVDPKLAAWATMHLFAETSNLILLFSSSERRASAEAAASQIAAAKNNIGHVLEAMGPAGRAGHIFAFPAALAATFSASPTSSVGNDNGRRNAGHEKRLVWWADCRQLFRLSEEKVRFIVARLGLDDSSSASSSPTFSRPTASPSYYFLSNDRRLESASHHQSLFGASFRSPYGSVPAQRSPSSGSANGNGLVLPPLPSLRLSPASRQSDEGLSLRLSPISSAAQHPSGNGPRHVSHSPPTPALSLTRGSRTESVSSSSQQEAASPSGSIDGASYSAPPPHHHHHHQHGSDSAARSSFHLHDEHDADAAEEVVAKRPRFSASFSDSGVVAPKRSALVL